MAVRKLFISHSSKTPGNLELLRTLCEILDDPASGYRLIYDKNGDITAGSDWYRQIDRWMAQCHAAVILFSQAALYDSDWIKKEATILAWRKELQDDFVLIPVLLDGLKPEELERGLFGVLRIRARQCLHAKSDAPALAEEIMTALAAQAKLQRCLPLDPTTDQLTFDPLEGIIANLIEKAGSVSDLEELIADLDLNLPSWPPDNRKQCALAISRHLLTEPKDALNRLQEILDGFRETPAEKKVDDLFRYLGRQWVDPIAASGIAASQIENRTVALNGNNVSDYTAQRYSERAWPLSRRWELVNVNIASRTFHAMREDIEDRFSGGRNLPPKERTNRVNSEKAPVVVVLPTICLEQQGQPIRLLDQLRATFPNVIFLIDAGQNPPDWVPDDVALLDPALDLQTEQEQMRLHDATKRYIKKLNQGT